MSTATATSDGRAEWEVDGLARELSADELMAQPSGQLIRLRDVAQIFCDEAVEQLAAMRAAIVSRNGPALAAAARSFREPLGFLQATAADRLAAELEDRGEREDFNGATRAALMLSLESNRLRYRLLDFQIAVHYELRHREDAMVALSA